MANDRQADIDALREKRSFEQQERIAREREKFEIIKKQKLLAEIDNVRSKMFKEKEQKLSEEVQKEKTEFFKILNEMKHQEDREQAIK